VEGLSADICVPIRLTLELAAIITVVLLIVGTPIACWLARSHAWWKENVVALVAVPLVLPSTVLGFNLLMLLGPNGPGGALAGLWGARTLAFTFEGLVIGSVLYSMPFVVQPIRNAFEAFGDRPLEGRGHMERIARACLLDLHVDINGLRCGGTSRAWHAQVGSQPASKFSFAPDSRRKAAFPTFADHAPRLRPIAPAEAVPQWFRGVPRRIQKPAEAGFSHRHNCP